MRTHKSLVLAAMALGMAWAVPAYADTEICPDPDTSCSYSLNNYIGTGNPTGSPWGTITLTQDGANVDVSVVLNSGNSFVSTGAGEALLWDFSGDPSITITGLSSGFGFDSNPCGGSGKNCDGSGHWDYGIECTSCVGGSNTSYTSLAFSITGAKLDQFIENEKGFQLVSDLCLNITGTTCGFTGDVGTNGLGTVPEPMTLSLFGVGLLGMGALSRRRRRKHSA